MMKSFKNILFVGLLVFLFVEVLVVFPKKLEHQEDETTTPVEETDTSQPEQKMNGVHLVETQQGHRDWELFSEAAEGSQGTGAWELNKVKVVFFSKDKVSFTVTGDHGSIDGKSKDLKIRGNVVTRSENGYVFKTPSASYDSKKREIVSPEKVTMLGPKDEMGEGFVLNGRDMKVLVDENQMFINEEVRGDKKFKDGKKFHISSNKADFSGKSREAKFTGNVDMTYDSLRMQGPVATFLYNGNTDLVHYVQIQGGVKVSDENKVATSDTLNLDVSQNMFTFLGHPKVLQNNDELSGEEIIFLDGGKKVKVEKVRAQMEKKE